MLCARALSSFSLSLSKLIFDDLQFAWLNVNNQFVPSAGSVVVTEQTNNFYHLLKAIHRLTISVRFLFDLLTILYFSTW